MTKKLEASYSTGETARLLGVTKQTIFKFLSLEAPEDAVIPPDAWFRLPAGHIRIKAWVILDLQDSDI